MKAVLLLAIVSCGGGQTSARVVEFGAIAATCAEREVAIVARTGTTEAEDLASVAAIREVCDSLLQQAEAR